METSRRPDVVAIHSVDRVIYSVPDLTEAEAFYRAFGLEVRTRPGRLDLYTVGHGHCWASIFASTGQPGKRLEYLRLGIFAEDEDEFRRRARWLGPCSPHPLSDGAGIWIRDPDGTPLQLVVAPKVSPSRKSPHTPRVAVPPGQGAAPSRSSSPRVTPRHLSHVLFFSPDVLRMTRFACEQLGLRLSDRSQDIIAFLHTPHGSDHHLVAFAKSDRAGLHHSSWDVGSIDDVGSGAEQMRAAGHGRGWGLGRHVLGSNYFHYVRDPWDSYAEYSFDIDFVPHDLDWPAADHPPHDSLYVWGPALPEDFIQNFEAPARA